MRHLSPFRRIALTGIAVLSLMSVPAEPVQAQEDAQILCFVTFGTVCFTMTLLCEEHPLIPGRYCDDFFDRCAFLAVELCLL